MPKSNQETSFHGKLIKSVVEYWLLRVLFEQNDQVLRNKLSSFIEEYIPSIEVEVDWDESLDLIDLNAVAGNIYYEDENELKKNMGFYVSTSGVKIQEYEKEN